MLMYSGSATQAATFPRSTKAVRQAAFECPIPDGLFPDPADPQRFYSCQDGSARLFECPPLTVFNEAARACAFELDAEPLLRRGAA